MLITKIPEIQAMTILHDHGYPNTNKPFYAKELGLTSAQIIMLRSYGMLQPTNNSRLEFVETYPRNFIQVRAKQWILTDYGKNVLKRDFTYSAHVLIQLAQTLKEKGFF